MHGYGYWSGGGTGAWMIFHGAFWVLLVVALIAGVFLIRPNRIGGREDEASTALDLLDQRYAKGEIDRDEYLQRKKDIVDKPHPPDPSQG